MKGGSFLKVNIGKFNFKDPHILDKLKAGMGQASGILLNDIVRSMQGNPAAHTVPWIQTGHLISNIEISGVNIGGNYIASGVISKADYSEKHEYGQGVKPRPFMFPALQRKRDDIIRAFSSALKGL